MTTLPIHGPIADWAIAQIPTVVINDHLGFLAREIEQMARRYGDAEEEQDDHAEQLRLNAQIAYRRAEAELDRLHAEQDVWRTIVRDRRAPRPQAPRAVVYTVRGNDSGGAA